MGEAHAAGAARSGRVCHRRDAEPERDEPLRVGFRRRPFGAAQRRRLASGAAGEERDRHDEEPGAGEAEVERRRRAKTYRTMPCCATAMLSRVEFFTRYIISSACRMISCALLASSG